MASRRDRIRKVMADAGGTMRTQEIADAMGEERALINHDMQSLLQRDEIERTGRGCYRMKGLTKKDRMWRIVRARRTGLTADVLAELAGVCMAYAKSFLRALEAREVLGRKRGAGNAWVYRLKNDPGPMTPVSTNEDVAKALAWKRVLTARAEADKAMIKLTKEIEAYDAKYGEKTEDGPDGNEAA